MTPLHVLDVAIVGAGMAGLSCARALVEAGLKVAVFDKARGAGGRMATRRGELASFDHGAQYFTARSPDFAAALQSWLAAGVVAPWRGRIVAWDGSGFSVAGEEARYVGQPGMSGLCRHLLGELECASQHKLSSFERDGAGWRLDFDNGETAACRKLVLALPAPQAAALLEGLPDLQAQAAGVVMSPCWAGMLRFADPLALEFDGCFVNQGPLSWVARNNSKPGRPKGEAWLLHASSAWSQAHVNDKEDQVGRALLAAFAELSGLMLDAQEVSTHRWLYAQAEAPLEVGCLFDAKAGIGLAGDWLNGSRVEGAWDSGRQLAAKIIAAS